MNTIPIEGLKLASVVSVVSVHARMNTIPIEGLKRGVAYFAKMMVNTRE